MSQVEMFFWLFSYVAVMLLPLLLIFLDLLFIWTYVVGPSPVLVFEKACVFQPLHTGGMVARVARVAARIVTLNDTNHHRKCHSSPAFVSCV
jgi:hypothetical protein